MIYRNIADLLENKLVGCFDEIPTILNSPAQQLLRCVRTLLTMTREKIEKKIQGRFTIIRFTHQFVFITGSRTFWNSPIERQHLHQFGELSDTELCK